MQASNQMPLVNCKDVATSIASEQRAYDELISIGATYTELVVQSSCALIAPTRLYLKLSTTAVVQR